MESDGDLAGALDYMEICDDETGFIPDKTGTGTLGNLADIVGEAVAPEARVSDINNTAFDFKR